MPAQFHAAANIRGGRGKTKTKEKIGANKTLHYGSSANTATNKQSKHRAQSRARPSAHWPV